MKLNAQGRLRFAARLAFITGAGMAANAVYAQAVDPAVPASSVEAAGTATTTEPLTENTPTSKAQQLGGVQVTGSRIRSPNLTSTSPITVVGAAELKFQGTNRVEDLLNNLPQVFADQGGNINNGADGTATVNLRNLGASRTLVLIDGKRTAPGSPGSSNADLNFIPAQLIDRVEVLTGGASAVYGSDAIAGVVNFVLKKDFEGIRVDYQRTGYLHENDQDTLRQYNSNAGFAPPSKQKFDGGGNNLSFLFGINTGDGKGNATIYANYLQLDGITQDQRDFGNCQLTADSDTSFACGGSGTSFPGSFTIAARGAAPRVRLTVDQGSGEFRNFNTGTDLYNFNPLNYYQRPVERYSFGGTAHYKLNDAVDAYTQVMFSDDRTRTLAAPSGAFGLPASISCDSPLLTPGQRAAICTSRGLAPTDRQNITIGRRNVEGGPRTADFDRYQYRIVSGLRGDFLTNWSYDASIQYGSAVNQQSQNGYFSNSRLANALNVVTVGGVAQCANGGADGCVPYNIYGVGTVTQDQLDYLNLGSLSSGTTTQHLATGSVTGLLGDYGLKSPFAEEGVGVSFGGEYRRETARTANDETATSGDLAGGGGASTPIDVGFTVREVFTEIKVPLAQHLPFAEELSVEAGYRFSQYSSVADTTTWKLAAEWAPSKDIRFRGGFNRAVRAPSLGDISDPTTVFLGGSTDPCSGAIDPATGIVDGGATRAQCARDPLIAANPGLYGQIDGDPASQYNARGGTSGLRAESSRTFTGGLVFTPTFFKGFNFTVDYFDIQVDNLIGRVGADTVLNLCYTQGLFCDRINRNPNTGSTSFGTLFGPTEGFTDAPVGNNGILIVRGIDIAANYRLKLSDFGLATPGAVLFDYVGTRSLKQDNQPVTDLPISNQSCNGRFGPSCGTPIPLYRHKLRTTYSVPLDWQQTQLTFSTAWRLTSAVSIDGPSEGNANNIDRRLASENYIDLTAAATFRGAYTFRVGVNNVFDNNPPTIGSTALSAVFGNGNTYPQVYDSLGRLLFASVTLDF